MEAFWLQVTLFKRCVSGFRWKGCWLQCLPCPLQGSTGTKCPIHTAEWDICWVLVCKVDYCLLKMNPQTLQRIILYPNAQIQLCNLKWFFCSLVEIGVFTFVSRAEHKLPISYKNFIFETLAEWWPVYFSCRGSFWRALRCLGNPLLAADSRLPTYTVGADLTRLSHWDSVTQLADRHPEPKAGGAVW